MFDSAKQAKLYALMIEKKIDCVMIGPSGGLEYLIGFNPGGCERFQALFITSGGKYFYIVNELYLEDMRRCFPEEADFYVWRDSDGWHEKLSQALGDFDLNGKTIAAGETIRAVDLIDMKGFFSGKFVSGTELLEEFRVIKSESDLDKLRTAARIADEVMGEIRDFIRPGMTEKDIKAKIGELFAEKGAEGLSFTPIVASGSNSSKPHYCEDGRVIAEKDTIILDFGCKFGGFCSDISRTFFVGGISEEQRKIYDIVSRAHDAAVDKAAEGVTCGSVDQAAREIIEAEGYGNSFLNRTGHGIGFDVHEAPYIRGNSDQVLARGMAFSIEPGIYITGEVGMRIEDIVVINHQGETEVLNNFPREIVIIP